jgi:hypothetical protein
LPAGAGLAKVNSELNVLQGDSSDLYPPTPAVPESMKLLALRNKVVRYYMGMGGVFSSLRICTKQFERTKKENHLLFKNKHDQSQLPFNWLTLQHFSV